jgi:hypothetical protein
MTLNISAECCYAECHYAECRGTLKTCQENIKFILLVSALALRDIIAFK